MGEAIEGVPGSHPLSGGPEAADADPAPSIGRYLARQRKLRGMDLEEVVTLTRIPRRSLERLESGAFDGVTDGFVRGFVRTVAVAIGLDPDEAVARMLVEPQLGPGRRWPRAGALIGTAVGVCLLMALGVTVAARLGRPEPAVAASPRVERPATLLRRDPVRALAEAQLPSVSPGPDPAAAAPSPVSESFSPPSP